MRKGLYWSNVDSLRKMSMISIDVLCRGIDAILYKKYGVEEVENRNLHVKQPTYTYYVSKPLAPSPSPEIDHAVRAFFSIAADTDLENRTLALSECSSIVTAGLITDPDSDTFWGTNLWDNLERIESFYDAAGRKFPDIGLEKTYKSKLKSKTAMIPLKSIRRLADEIGYHEAYPILYLRKFSPELAILVKANIFFPLQEYGKCISPDDSSLFQVIVDSTLTSVSLFEAYECSSTKPEFERFKKDMKQIQKILSKYDISDLKRILSE